VQNAYTRVVKEEGNPAALKMLARVYREVDRNWRGIGTIPLSGWGLTPEFAELDAENRFDLAEIRTRESEVCIAGQILRGLKKPHECPAFGAPCSPENPLGAPMVSSEGACAAYYRFGRQKETQ
jgi:hydrogenase expression/formation protein HypD